MHLSRAPPVPHRPRSPPGRSHSLAVPVHGHDVAAQGLERVELAAPGVELSHAVPPFIGKGARMVVAPGLRALPRTTVRALSTIKGPARQGP